MKRTYCVQIGFHVITDTDEFEHFVQCKPYKLIEATNKKGERCDYFQCACGQSQISLDKISALISLARFEGGIHLRID